MSSVSVALLVVQALFSIGLTAWQSSRYEQISKALLMRTTLRIMDVCLSKLDELGVRVKSTNVRGCHASSRIMAIGHVAGRVQECTREFIREQV